MFSFSVLNPGTQNCYAVVILKCLCGVSRIRVMSSKVILPSSESWNLGESNGNGL